MQLLDPGDIEDIEVELGTIDPFVVGTNQLASRFVFTKTRGGRVLPMFRCDEMFGGVLLQQPSLLGEGKPMVSKILRQKKAIIDSEVLPAVGVLFVLYPQHDYAAHGSAFVSSSPISGKQHILTAFHNVRPMKFTTRDAWEWPIVIFSNSVVGKVDRYRQWKDEGEPDNLYVTASFSLPLLKQWQGCEDLEHPTFLYATDNEHDLIELEIPAVFPKHLALNLDNKPFVRSQVICVGYPGEDAPPETYRSTPSYVETAALRSFTAEMKTVAWGYLESVVGTLARHSCSTALHNSGSPILCLDDLVEGEVPLVSCVHVCNPADTEHASQNFNIGIYKTYWIK